MYNESDFWEDNVDQANTIDSKFRVAIMVARRAKQLINGAKPMVEIEAHNPLTIALEEVNRGLVTAELLDDVNIYLREAREFLESGEEQSEEGEDESGDSKQTENEVELEAAAEAITEPESEKTKDPDLKETKE